MPGVLKTKAAGVQLHDQVFEHDGFMEELASVVRSNVERGRFRRV